METTFNVSLHPYSTGLVVEWINNKFAYDVITVVLGPLLKAGFMCFDFAGRVSESCVVNSCSSAAAVSIAWHFSKLCVKCGAGLALSFLEHRSPMFPFMLSLDSLSLVLTVAGDTTAGGTLLFALATRSPEYLTPFNSRLTTNCCWPFSLVPTLNKRRSFEYLYINRASNWHTYHCVWRGIAFPTINLKHRRDSMRNWQLKNCFCHRKCRSIHNFDVDYVV